MLHSLTPYTASQCFSVKYYFMAEPLSSQPFCLTEANPCSSTAIPWSSIIPRPPLTLQGAHCVRSLNEVRGIDPLWPLNVPLSNPIPCRPVSHQAAISCQMEEKQLTALASLSFAILLISFCHIVKLFIATQFTFECLCVVSLYLC